MSSPFTRQMVRALRERLGDDLEGFAERVGVSSRTVRRWEDEGHKPMPLAARRLHAIQSEHLKKEASANGGAQRLSPELPHEERTTNAGVAIPSRVTRV